MKATFTHVHKVAVTIRRSEWVPNANGGGTRREIAPVFTTVTIAADLESIARDLAYRAYHSKRKRATAIAGRVVVTV